MTNNNHHQPCDFSEALVSYLYGESDAAESEKFRAHAAACAACSAEIAGLGVVRSQIAEWRQEEFAPMASPVFKLSAELPAREQVIITDEPTPWLDGIRAFFTPKMALAAAGFAAIALFAGLTFVVLNSGSNNMVAKNDSPDKKNNEVSNKIINSTSEITPEERVATAVTGTANESKGSAAQPPVNNIKPARQNAGSAANTKNDGTVNVTNTTNITKVKDAPKTTTAQKPKLDPNYVEDEDDSLRLADLFAEADTDDMN